MNDSEGMGGQKFDGTAVKCIIHIVFISADGLDSQLLSGAIGGNGKACCRMSLFHGYD